MCSRDKGKDTATPSVDNRNSCLRALCPRPPDWVQPLSKAKGPYTPYLDAHTRAYMRVVQAHDADSPHPQTHSHACDAEAQPRPLGLQQAGACVVAPAERSRDTAGLQRDTAAAKPQREQRRFKPCSPVLRSFCPPYTPLWLPSTQGWQASSRETLSTQHVKCHQLGCRLHTSTKALQECANS